MPNDKGSDCHQPDSEEGETQPRRTLLRSWLRRRFVVGLIFQALDPPFDVINHGFNLINASFNAVYMPL